jgi:hypothetical protein
MSAPPMHRGNFEKDQSIRRATSQRGKDSYRGGRGSVWIPACAGMTAIESVVAVKLYPSIWMI